LDNLETVRAQFTKQAVPFSNAPAMRDSAAIALLIDAAGAAPLQRTLDVACGPGLVVHAFARVVSHASGIDATPAMIARASELGREQGLANIELRVGEATALPYEDGTFDAVTCRFAFHHIPELSTVMKEMVRVCRVGGKVVVCDACASDDPIKAAAFNRMERLRDPSTVRFLALSELASLFEQMGLGAPERRFYQTPLDLDSLMKGSFPAETDAPRVRQLIEASLQNDELGLGTKLHDGRISLAYPTVILSAQRP